MLRVTTSDELAADALWSLGAIAVTERDDALEAGFTDSDTEVSALAVIAERWPAQIVDDDADAWADVWRSGARPVRVDGVLVVPAWLDPPDDPTGGVTVISIDPGRAFGIGSHPTTRLSLEALLAAVRPGDRVLDVGTGTGVLAIAAVRAGAASHATGIDIDDEAVRIAASNAAANGCASAIDMRLASIESAATSYDVVVANLGGLLTPLALADQFGRVASRVLVVGGLLDPSVSGPPPDPLDGALAVQGFSVVGVQVADGWMTRTYARLPEDVEARVVSRGGTRARRDRGSPAPTGRASSGTARPLAR